MGLQRRLFGANNATEQLSVRMDPVLGPAGPDPTLGQLGLKDVPKLHRDDSR